MDNPLHILKKSLELRNWRMAEIAYSELTGEEPPKQLVPTASPQPLLLDEMRPASFAEINVPESVETAIRQSDERKLVLGTEADLKTLETSSSIPHESLESSYVPGHNTIPEQTKAVPQEPAKPVPAHRANLEQFRVKRDQQPRVISEKGVQARLEDAPPMQANKFNDNLTEARQELKFDQMLVERGVRAAERNVDNRPPQQLVKVTCRDCGGTKEVAPADVPPRSMGRGDREGATYVCDSCIRNKVQVRRRGE